MSYKVICYTGLGGTELYHYNHNHDRLGRFARAVNGSISSTNVGTPRSYKKQLNKLDRLSTTARGRAMESEHRAKRAKYKGKTEKANQLTKTARSYRKQDTKLTTAKNKLVKEAVSKNYNVSMYEVHRNSKRNQDIAMSVMSSVLVRPIIVVPAYNYAVRRHSRKEYGMEYGGENPRKVRGYKYNVKKNKYGTKGTVYK